METPPLIRGRRITSATEYRQDHRPIGPICGDVTNSGRSDLEGSDTALSPTFQRGSVGQSELRILPHQEDMATDSRSFGACRAEIDTTFGTLGNQWENPRHASWEYCHIRETCGRDEFPDLVIGCFTPLIVETNDRAV